MLLLLITIQEVAPAPTLETAKALVELRSPEAMTLRLELFDECWATDQGVYLRDWFYAGMRRSDSLEEGNLLAHAAANDGASEALRILCLQALEESIAPVDARLLFEPRLALAPAAVNRAWQTAAGRCLAESRVQFAPPFDPAQARALLLAAGAPFLGHAFLQDWTEEESTAIAEAATKAKSAPDRAQALRVLATRHNRQQPFVVAATAALKARLRAPRAAALLAAAEQDTYEAVPLLVSFLEQAALEAEGRWPHETAEALRMLTGLPFGPKPEVWRRWLEEEGALWLANRREQLGRSPVADGVQRTNESDTVNARFFGLPVDSTRVAILVESSSTLRSGRLGDSDAVDAVAREVSTFCAQLPEKSTFQVWAMEGQPVPLFNHAMPTNRSNRRQAEKFLRARREPGVSAWVEALDAAMQDPAVDTIILVGAGGSSAGLHAEDELVLAAVKRFYARQGVRIHTVLVTANEANDSLMSRLAEATGGRTVRATASGQIRR